MFRGYGYLILAVAVLLILIPALLRLLGVI